MSNCEQKNRSAKPNVLCDTCCTISIQLRTHMGESLIIDGPIRPEMKSVLAKYSIHEVQVSGLRGCHLCSIISQAVCPVHSEHSIAKASKSTVVIKPRYTHIYPALPDGTHRSRLYDLQAQLLDSEGKIINTEGFPVETNYEYYSHHPLPASWSFWTGSDASFDLARQWLDHCVSNHTLCEEIRNAPASNHKSTFLEFLIDVGHGHDDPICLCRTNDLADRPQYLTLSHRWGDSPIFRLIGENLSTLLSAINPSDLPRTFQDAIVITRRLGHRYLWIDSLCIIQDSREHWEQESAIMGDIYRHTACTIAALGATDGNSGCFKTRNPLCFQICESRLGGDKPIYILPSGTINSTLSLATQRTGYGPQVEPLHERAWVMQEWMLSPRTLHYGTLGMHWECATHNSNDRITKPSSLTPSPKYALQKACNPRLSGKLDESYWEFSKWWKSVLPVYSACGMTYQTDRLVAINGIIKLVESTTALHNIAGLWKEYLFPELLWSAKKVAEHREEAYQGPTWSWASLNCEVSSGVPDPSYAFNWKLELLEAVVHPVADNGQISGAHIRVRGLLQAVRLGRSGSSLLLKWGEEGAHRNSADRAIYFFPDLKPRRGQKLWALWVVHAIADASYMNMGLVLAKKDNMNNDVWVRVGMFRQYDRPDTPSRIFQDGGAELKEIVIE